jgi:hypothetical protein
VWRVKPHAIDLLLAKLTGHLGVSQGVLLEALKIHAASVSRVRSGVYKDIPLDWLVRMYDLTGIPIDELRAIAGIAPSMERWKARIMRQEEAA